MPYVPQNVNLVAGWVESTLPRFLEKTDVSAVRLVHMDLDLYKPSFLVLSTLGPHLAPGTLILFDEYFGFPFWEVGEHRALRDSGLDFEYVAFTTAAPSNSAEQVLIRLL